MNYYKLGDLTHYITNDFFNIDWYNKLSKLLCIVSGLKNIHDTDIIHKDYHSKNLFITQHGVVTGDLGITKSAIEEDDNEIYGIIPYVAPEIFQGQKYTKASDVYSFSMIMWELITGRRPFWNENHDTDLIIRICDGLRPPIINNAPEGYVELMQECWHSNPEKRPTATELFGKFANIYNNELGKRYTGNLTKVIESPDIGPMVTNNPGAI